MAGPTNNKGDDVDPDACVVMEFSYKYDDMANKDKTNDILTRVIEFNRQSDMFGKHLLSYRFTQTADGFDAIELFKSGASAQAYYENFEKCPFIEEVMELATLAVLKSNGKVIALPAARDSSPKILENYPITGEYA